MEDIMSLDLYELIGAAPTATIPEIKKAYRKKALSCHPDKNPDNPNAAALFHRLSRALEILTDVSAKAAYDKVVNAKQQAKVRARQLDSKRRKLKEELEAREEAYERSRTSRQNDEQRLKEEIERLQKEGSKQVEEEVAYVQKKIYEELHRAQHREDDPKRRRIKLKWKVEAEDTGNGSYDEDTLRRILSKYGDIAVLVVSSNKKGRGLVEYTDESAAKTAAQIEMGLVENPLTLEGLWESRTTTKSNRRKESHTTTFPSAKPEVSTSCAFPSFSSAPDIFATRQYKVSDAEFETSVLSNLRRAEERKRLLEKLKSEKDT